VYHRGEFLCRAVSPEIASVTVSLQDLQAARNQRRRELRQQLTARRSLVELLTQPNPSAPERRAESPATKNPVAARTTRRGTRLKLYRED
jgi:putative transposase